MAVGIGLGSAQHLQKEGVRAGVQRL
jgi:hypothetical protein